MKHFLLFGMLSAFALLAGACSSTRQGDVLLILDEGAAVVIVNPDGGVVERFEPASDAAYFQPIWASTDTFVRAETSPQGNHLAAIRIGGEEVWDVEFATPPFYYLASLKEDSATVILLRNNDFSPGLVAEVVSGVGSVDPVGNGAPFYMTWDPDSDRFATHVGAVRLDVHAEITETISDSAGMFQAPVWLEAGLVTLRTENTRTFLSLWDGAEFADLATVRGPARFVGAGNRLAVQTTNSSDPGAILASAQTIPAISTGVLTVIDLTSGSLSAISSDPALVYQWDATGNRLLFLDFVNDGDLAVQWHVWEGGDVTDFEQFAVNVSWLQSFGPFFDQYAQSVSLWAPDGSAFVYPAIVDGEPRILVQDIDDETATDVASGVWVAWSP